LYTERLSTSKNELLFGDTVTFLFGEMGWELFSCLPIDSTAKDGTIDGEDFNQLLTMRAMDEQHEGDLPPAFRQSGLSKEFASCGCFTPCAPCSDIFFIIGEDLKNSPAPCSVYLLASETDVGGPIIVPWKADFGDALVFGKRDDIFIGFSCLYPVRDLLLYLHVAHRMVTNACLFQLAEKGDTFLEAFLLGFRLLRFSH
jgi:hypothetical protein